MSQTWLPLAAAAADDVHLEDCLDTVGDVEHLPFLEPASVVLPGCRVFEVLSPSFGGPGPSKIGRGVLGLSFAASCSSCWSWLLGLASRARKARLQTRSSKGQKRLRNWSRWRGRCLKCLARAIFPRKARLVCTAFCATPGPSALSYGPLSCSRSKVSSPT